MWSVAKNLQKIHEKFAKNLRNIREIFAKNSRKIHEKLRFAKYLRKIHEKIRKISQMLIFREFFANFLRIFCEYFANFSQIFCKYFANFLQQTTWRVRYFSILQIYNATWTHAWFSLIVDSAQVCVAPTYLIK